MKTATDLRANIRAFMEELSGGTAQPCVACGVMVWRVDMPDEALAAFTEDLERHIHG